MIRLRLPGSERKFSCFDKISEYRNKMTVLQYLTLIQIEKTATTSA